MIRAIYNIISLHIKSRIFSRYNHFNKFGSVQYFNIFSSISHHKNPLSYTFFSFVTNVNCKNLHLFCVQLYLPQSNFVLVPLEMLVYGTTSCSHRGNKRQLSQILMKIDFLSYGNYYCRWAYNMFSSKDLYPKIKEGRLLLLVQWLTLYVNLTVPQILRYLFKQFLWCFCKGVSRRN